MRAKNFERQFDEKNFGDMVDFLNSLFQNGISLGNNLSGQILDLILPTDGTEVKIAHRLGTIPKYRIVLRQSDAVVIYDGEENWNDKYITLRASGVATSGSAVTVPQQDLLLFVSPLEPGPPSSTVILENDILEISRLRARFNQNNLNVSGGSTSVGDVRVTMLLLVN